MKKYNDFKKKFDVDRFVIREYKYWIWCLRKNQSTLGSSVLIPQKEHLKLSDLTKEELTELNQVYSNIEETLYRLFNYSKINYLTLMMVDPVVHTHILPRYKQNVKYRGLEYNDSKYPNIPELNSDLVEDSIKEKIVKDLKELL